MSERKQPPIWTWAAALALAAIVIGGLLAFDAATQSRFILDGLNLARLERPIPPGARRIVVLGSSKTLCGFAYDQDMEARFRRVEREVGFTRIAVLGAPPRQVAYSFNAIINSHPDLVLLESDLLLLQPGGYNGGDRAIEQGWQSRVRAKLKELAGFREHSPNDPAAAGPCDDSITQKPVPTVEEFAAVLKTKRRVSTAAEQRPYLDFIAKLQAQGAEVGLIDIPLAPEIEQVIPQRLAGDRARLCGRLAAEHRLLHIGPGLLPKSAYIDDGHLNAEGRERFTTWFIGEAVKRLRPADA